MSGGLVIGVAVAASAVLVALVLGRVPRRWRPLLVGATLLPTLTAAAALGLPESAIHFSDDAEWAYRAGREISLGALVLGAALAAGLAARYRSRLIVIAGIALVTFGIATVARDLVARDEEPSWCYAERVEKIGDEVRTSGDRDGCTVLLPARKL